METFIPASSPLFSYNPSPLFTSPDTAVEADETGTVDLTGQEVRIAVNFTGTGVTFLFSQQSPAAAFTSTLLVNGTTHSPFAVNDTSINAGALPLGRHGFELVLTRRRDAKDPVRFSGVRGITGFAFGPESRNTTVDDTAWREWKVILSPGWNMLEAGGESNWINRTQLDEETKTVGKNWNESISWTEQQGASTTIWFEGEAVWAYGISGGETGRYEVRLDNIPQGTFDASGSPRIYDSLLYHASGLAPASPHNLTLTNLEQGRRLSFDRLVAASGLVLAPASSPPPTLSPAPASTPAAAHGSHLSAGAIAGIALPVSILGLALLVWAIRACLIVRGRRGAAPKSSTQSEPPVKVNKSFFRLSIPPAATRHKDFPPFRPPTTKKSTDMSSFVPLPSPNSQSDFNPTFASPFSSPGSHTTPFEKLESPVPPAPAADEQTSFLKLGGSKSVPLKVKRTPSPTSTIPSPATLPPTKLARGPSVRQPAISAALSSSTSPLTQLIRSSRTVKAPPETGDSYFPKLSSLGSKLARQWSRGADSSLRSYEHERMGSEGASSVLSRPMTDGGILDAYASGGEDREKGARWIEHQTGGQGQKDVPNSVRSGWI